MIAAAETLRAALAYAAAGWPVFPTRPDDASCPGGKDCGCKAPVTQSGFKDATSDPEIIRGWWRRWWPLANVAIATGAPGPDVLDVDVKPGGSGYTALNKLKRAGLLTGASRLVRTRSGGLHVYYAGTSQRGGALPRHHLDFKAGAGGYVVAPPSRVHGKPYQLLDHRPGAAALEWAAVKRLLDPPRRSAARPQHMAGRGPAGHRPEGPRRTGHGPVSGPAPAGRRLRPGRHERDRHPPARRELPARPREVDGARLDAEVERSLRRIGA